MVEASPNLRVLDRSDVAHELDLVPAVFHRINRIIPGTQTRRFEPGRVPGAVAGPWMNALAIS